MEIILMLHLNYQFTFLSLNQLAYLLAIDENLYYFASLYLSMKLNFQNVFVRSQ